MRILYIGNFSHRWCTEVHVARDAERISGVSVTRLQEPRDAGRGFLNRIERTAEGHDLVIYQRTWGLPVAATSLWRRLEARGIKTMSYHLDLYVGLQRSASIAGDPFWTTGTVFTADGDPYTQEFLEKRGIDHRWMPAAVVSDETEIADPTPVPPAFDVVFVGSDPDLYHPEWPWRRELIDGLSARYGARFARLPVEHVRIHSEALSQLYATVPVVVGDSLCPPGHRNYWSDRFYETVGRGGFLIGPNVPGIEQHFTSGDHLWLYTIGDLEHVTYLVDQALADRAETRAVARAGNAHVRAHHTYRHRVAAILSSLGFRP